MIGMDARTGRPLQGHAHLEQSVRDILSTPRGSRLMRRDYGCDLFSLLDQPVTPAFIARVQAAVAMALTIHEPRLRLTRVTVQPGSGPDEGGEPTPSGQISLLIEGYSIPDERPVTLKGMSLG